jgi:cell division transport system permease protein
MIRHRAILPLSRDPASRFLPWLIAFMVWLAGLALAGAMQIQTTSDAWVKGVAGRLTMQVVPLADESAEALEARIGRALALLRETPGVARAEAMPKEAAAALLEPWLGKSALVEELPVPRMIDVVLEDGAPMDTRALGARIAAQVPGTSLEDHGLWLANLVTLAGAIQAIAFAIVGLIALAAVATVVFATKTGLAIHHEVVELLHLIGARDGFVAREFQGHAFRLGLKGGIGGFVLVAATVAVVVYLAGRVEAGLLPPIALGLAQWAALAGLAVAVALIAMVTARLTVLRALARMP